MLVGNVEVPYEYTPPHSIDFYALSEETCCQKQITGNIVKIAIFNMAAMNKCPKINNGNFRKF